MPSDAAAPPAFQALDEISPPLRSVTFEIDEPTPTMNTIRGMHHFEYKALRERFAWKTRAALNHVRYFNQAPMEHCAIAISRYSTGSPDADGLSGGVKPLVDCFVISGLSHPSGLGVIRDDSHDRMRLSVTNVRVSDVWDQRTVVTIQELPTPLVPAKPKRKRGKLASRFGAAKKGAASRKLITGNAARIGLARLGIR